MKLHNKYRNELKKQRARLESRIINLCSSRQLKNSIMRDIDNLCLAQKLYTLACQEPSHEV